MSLQNKTIAFIGAGNMAEALIRGLLKAGTIQPAQGIVTDVRAKRLRFVEKTSGVVAIESNTQAVAVVKTR